MKKPISNLVNKDTLVRRILASEKVQNLKLRNKPTMEMVRTIYDELEKQIIRELAEIDETKDVNNPVTIRLFDGVTIVGYFKPPINFVPSFLKDKPDKLAKVDFKSKVNVKITATRYFKEKVTKLREQLINDKK